MRVRPVCKPHHTVVYQGTRESNFVRTFWAEVMILLPERHHIAKFFGASEKAIVFLCGNLLVVKFVTLGVKDVDELLPA